MRESSSQWGAGKIKLSLPTRALRILRYYMDKAMIMLPSPASHGSGSVVIGGLSGPYQ